MHLQVPPLRAGEPLHAPRTLTRPGRGRSRLLPRIMHFGRRVDVLGRGVSVVGCGLWAVGSFLPSPPSRSPPASPPTSPPLVPPVRMMPVLKARMWTRGVDTGAGQSCTARTPSLLYASLTLRSRPSCLPLSLPLSLSLSLSPSLSLFVSSSLSLPLCSPPRLTFLFLLPILSSLVCSLSPALF